MEESITLKRETYDFFYKKIHQLETELKNLKTVESHTAKALSGFIFNLYKRMPECSDIMQLAMTTAGYTVKYENEIGHVGQVGNGDIHIILNDKIIK